MNSAQFILFRDPTICGSSHFHPALNFPFVGTNKGRHPTKTTR